MAPHNSSKLSSACFYIPCGLSTEDDCDSSAGNQKYETISLGSITRIPMPHMYDHEPAAQESASLPEKDVHRIPTIRASGARRIKSETARNHRRVANQQTGPKSFRTLTEEDKRINRLVLEAMRYQANAARVSSLSDFQTMSVTLPAASQHNSEGKGKNGNSEVVASSPCRSTPNRRRGPMFRGKKARTSSAAADSFVAEAKQADRYYRPNLVKSCRNPLSDGEEAQLKHQLEQHALTAIDEDEDGYYHEHDRRGWKAWLPKKWTMPKSTLIDV